MWQRAIAEVRDGLLAPVLVTERRPARIRHPHKASQTKVTRVLLKVTGTVDREPYSRHSKTKELQSVEQLRNDGGFFEIPHREKLRLHAFLQCWGSGGRSWCKGANDMQPRRLQTET
jgi:hypothetical protein